MGTKEQLLRLLEENRERYVSGAAMAQAIGVSRNAVWKAVEALRAEGYAIDAVTNKGYALSQENDLLSPQGIERFLPPGHPFAISVRKRVDSTNSEARRRAAEGAPEGTVIVAEEQTAGKGRQGHSFFSPPDTGLYLSLLLRPKLSAQDALLLTTCAAAAVALAIEACAGVEAQIKWVNDVFCRGKKVCGILTEAALDLESGGLQYAIVGMGVNLFPPAGGFPADLPQAGAVYTARPQGLESRSQLAGEILNQFFAFYPHLEEKPFFQAYRDRSLVLGREVTVLERGQTRTALALDLNPDFSLQVREADGRERALASGEVRVKL